MKNMLTLAHFPGYQELLKSVQKEIADFELLVKKSAVLSQWRIGRHIDRYVLKHKIRAEHNTFLIAQLARDTGRDKSTLYRAVKIYRTIPKVADLPLLALDMLNTLIAVRDEKERKLIEGKVIRHNWSPNQLRDYLKTKRKLKAITDGTSPVPKLKFTRGRLNVYPVAAANKILAEFTMLALDLGFREQALVPGKAVRIKEGDFLELDFKGNVIRSAQKVSVSKDELFTYRAGVEKIIDGDTLITSLDFQLTTSLSQKLRLRGIDCPEMDTEEGQRAKRFVESRLKGCAFIIVKTYKDRSDKFDRYLADIFYKSGEADPGVVASEGTYLNQELLDAGLAVPWP